MIVAIGSRHFAGLLSATTLTLAGLSVAETSDFVIEEIIVTAQKRAETLQEVPIAISAFDERSLEEFAFDNVIDVADHVPNLNISTPFAASNPFIALRGIGNGGDFNPNIDSGVAVHIDDVFLQAPAGRLGQMFDLERLEVLRGPQGTLYGKNTTGGSINMISRKPGNEFEADIGLSFGDYGMSSIEAGISVPIVEDKLAARFAYTQNKRDGVANNLFNDTDVNDVDNRAGRIVVVFTPADDLTATLTYHMYENDTTQKIGKAQVLLNSAGQIERLPDGQIDLTNAVQDAFGYNGFADDPSPYNVNVNNEGYEEVDTWGTSLTIVKDWERFTLTSVTGYNDIERELYIDFDFSPNTLGENGVRDEAEHFSQELRLTYDNQDNLSAIGGLYYFDGKTQSDARFGWFGALYPRLQHIQDTKSYAVFAQLTYDINDRLSITPGIRYTDEEKDFWIRSDFLVQQFSPAFLSDEVGAIVGPVIPPTTNSESWDEISGKVTLDYRLTDDALLYLTWSHGFKSGGYRLPVTRPDLAGTTVEPENLDSWELGLKTSWLERRVQFNLSAFYYDYTDLHVFSLNSSAIGADFVVNNAEAATLYGLEAEFTAYPVEGLEIYLNLGWLPEAEYDEFIFDPTGQAEDLSGARMQFTPEWDFSAVVQYRRPLGNGAIRGRVEFAHQDSSYSSPFETDRLNVGAYSTVDAALAYEINDQYELEVWVQNLTDEDDEVLYVDIEGFGFDMVNFLDPRTYGVTLRASF